MKIWRTCKILRTCSYVLLFFILFPRIKTEDYYLNVSTLNSCNWQSAISLHCFAMGLPLHSPSAIPCVPFCGSVSSGGWCWAPASAALSSNEAVICSLTLYQARDWCWWHVDVVIVVLREEPCWGVSTQLRVWLWGLPRLCGA